MVTLYTPARVTFCENIMQMKTISHQTALFGRTSPIFGGGTRHILAWKTARPQSIIRRPPAVIPSHNACIRNSVPPDRSITAGTMQPAPPVHRVHSTMQAWVVHKVRNLTAPVGGRGYGREAQGRRDAEATYPTPQLRPSRRPGSGPRRRAP